MKLLVLSRYDRQGASSRLRTMQYRPALEQAGFEVNYAPLFDAAYLQGLYSGKRSTGAILKAYRRRVGQLLRASDADAIWLEKEALPWVPGMLEERLLPKSIPLIADYDDAVFHRYDRHRSTAVRKLLGRKIARVMAAADLVTAGNAYLAAYATDAAKPAVEIVPTVVDTDVYDASPRLGSEGTCRIGWIGTPGTWGDCVQPFLPVIRGALENAGAEILAVGAGDAARDIPDVTVRDWAETREVEDTREMDIGIMPLPDTPWMRGKCGYKLIQYMACGLPVVASPVGVNAEIVEHGVNGFLADSERDWQEALETLIGDPDLRHRMGKAGREKVERQYSLQVQGPRVAQLLIEAARGARRDDPT